ncbi:MAG: hypothetical protein O3B73_00765 [bacterium]|nr:hypothetical protein [bacterium]
MSMPQRVAATTKNSVFRLMASDIGDKTHFELYVNDALMMATYFSALAEKLSLAALSGVPGRHGEILIGGLGLGLTLRHVLYNQAVHSVCVVELEPRVVDWNRTHLGNSDLLDDPRVELVLGDFCEYVQGTPRNYHGIVLHLDEGPDQVMRVENRRVYSLGMMQVLHARLRSGGTLAMRARKPNPSFEKALLNHFSMVEAVAVADQDPDGKSQMCVVYQAKA